MVISKCLPQINARQNDSFYQISEILNIEAGKRRNAKFIEKHF